MRLSTVERISPIIFAFCWFHGAVWDSSKCLRGVCAPLHEMVTLSRVSLHVLVIRRLDELSRLEAPLHVTVCSFD